MAADNRQKREREWGEYAVRAHRTSPTNRPKHDRTRNAVLGLLGESGEICDLVKKFAFQSGNAFPLPDMDILKECGDVLWYTAELSACVDVPMSDFFCTPDYVKYIAEKKHVDELHAAGMDSSNKYLVNMLYRECVRIMKAVTGFNLSALPIDVSAGPLEDGTMKELMQAMRRAMAGITSVLMLSGHTLKEARDMNIEKLKKRYPDGFDPDKSLHRDEKK